jgi:nucleotide-binding universal stress UspA family protein
MYKHILCPIDGSVTSNRGLTEAINLAKNQEATLYLLHVVDVYFPMTSFIGEYDFNEVIKIMHKNGEELLEKAVKNAKKADIKVETNLIGAMQGPIYQSVLDYTKACHADLIVMGTHGLRGFKRFVMGSDAEAIVHASSIPVLLVKNHEHADNL